MRLIFPRIWFINLSYFLCDFSFFFNVYLNLNFPVFFCFERIIRNCVMFPRKTKIKNCQNFTFQTVKISLAKLSKISYQNCQNFPFQTVKISLFKLSNFPFQTVKISLFKLSNFPFQTVKISLSKLSKFTFSNCQNFPF